MLSESLSPSESLQGTRMEYSGTFIGIQKRINSYSGLYEWRIVFNDIRGPNSELLKDRQTFSYGQRFRSLNLQAGDRVQFFARVVLGKSGTFKLSRPTKVESAEDTVQLQLS